MSAPVRGAPTAVRFDGRVQWSWWGQDADDADRLAARGPHVLTWDTASDCRLAAESAGWALDPDPYGPAGGDVLDLHPTQEWLARRTLRLATGAGLGLWNWALDVAVSTGRTWNPRTTLADTCYRKLFAAQVPYFFDLEAFTPQWSPRQLRLLRDVLGSAVHVIRNAR